MDYQVNDNFDIDIPLVKVTDISTLLFQQVRLILDTWTGEFPYDITAGMPYKTDILGGNVDGTNIERIYYDKISVLQGFKSLENFSISQSSDRTLTISFDVTSTAGDAQNFIQEA